MRVVETNTNDATVKVGLDTYIGEESPSKIPAGITLSVDREKCPLKFEYGDIVIVTVEFKP